ncbi:HDOD domain-containing protein [Pseudomonas sp. GD03651]|jgi:HD-like signal output (HDOD) protein|uniref:Signal transduction protein n=5 Tax=Pseudomonadati TaxID=3379134 RepID=A0A2S3WKD2_PSEPU|nr:MULTISPECIES: HDOD domain-containing protein [Pseudomonas]AGN82324.1 hypothetical protein L483_15370 [Pseudomonas putida H8234]ELS0927134.1 HDOD domain-containing protein [Pseudomonas putida]ENY74119.1 putative signal transduction protein [Pseudomonas putida TRO1]MBA1319893.1 HDOD domain-containing protein [Pseudomonas monteilii]MCE1021531.1 HDOD domain-containing protein [Pseudomonas monteilii]
MKPLAKIFQNPAALPTISSVVMELLAMSRDPSVPLANIVKAVSLDQALAAKVLRTANSAYFGRSGTISRLEDAISTIGIHNFRTTIITTGLLKALPDAPGIDMPTYWKMGLHTAFMASFLAESIGADRDVAFTTGLMQGIGALLIHLVIPEEACVVVESVDPFDFAGRRPVEQIQLGFDNAEVGAELLKRWKFPAPIQKALQTYSNRSPLPDILGQLLSVSSTYAYGVVMGLDRSSLADQMDTEIINSLGLTHDLLDTCRQRVSESVLMIG